MKTYECYFKGRQVGAIGIFHDCIVTVKAENSDEARLKCYETHEHLQSFSCRVIPDGLAPRLPRNPQALWGFEPHTKVALFNQVKALGIPYANHETDLYIPVTDQTRKLIDAYEFKSNVTTFKNQVEGGIWYDIPFAYLPAWESKSRKETTK